MRVLGFPQEGAAVKGPRGSRQVHGHTEDTPQAPEDCSPHAAYRKKLKSGKDKNKCHSVA